MPQDHLNIPLPNNRWFDKWTFSIDQDYEFDCDEPPTLGEHRLDGLPEIGIFPFNMKSMVTVYDKTEPRHQQPLDCDAPNCNCGRQYRIDMEVVIRDKWGIGVPKWFTLGPQWISRTFTYSGYTYCLCCDPPPKKKKEKISLEELFDEWDSNLGRGSRPEKSPRRIPELVPAGNAFVLLLWVIAIVVGTVVAVNNPTHAVTAGVLTYLKVAAGFGAVSLLWVLGRQAERWTREKPKKDRSDDDQTTKESGGVPA